MDRTACLIRILCLCASSSMKPPGGQQRQVAHPDHPNSRSAEVRALSEGSFNRDASFLRPHITNIKFPDPLSRLKEAIRRLPEPPQGIHLFHPSAFSGSGRSAAVPSDITDEPGHGSGPGSAKLSRNPPPPPELWDIHASCSSGVLFLLFFRSSNVVKSAV